MAVTATLVFAGHNSLRYLISQDGAAGTSVTITTTGAATPDILTDSVQGPIKKVAKAFTDGYGKLPAGALTQAQARALYLSSPQSDVGIPTLTAELEPINVTVANTPIVADANVDGSGHPTLVVTAPAAACSAYLDISLPNAIGA